MPTPEQGIHNSYIEKRMSRRELFAKAGAVVAVLAGLGVEASKLEVGGFLRCDGKRVACGGLGLKDRVGYILSKEGSVISKSKDDRGHPEYWLTSEIEYYLFYAPNPVRVLATLAILGIAGAIIGPKIGLGLGDRFFLAPEEKEEKQRLEEERAQWRARLAAISQAGKERQEVVEDQARAKLESAKKVLRALDVRELLVGFKREVWGRKGNVDTIDGRFQTNGTIEQWPGFRLGFNHYTWRREEEPEHTEYRERPITIRIPARDFGGSTLPGYDVTIGTEQVPMKIPYKTWLERDEKMCSYVQVTAMDTTLVVSHNHDDTQPALGKAVSIDVGEGAPVVAQKLREALLSIANYQIENKLLPKDLKEKEDRQKASI